MKDPCDDDVLHPIVADSWTLRVNLIWFRVTVKQEVKILLFSMSQILRIEQ